MLKLAAHGLQDRFTFGAFADDHHDRNALGPIAKSRAELHFKTTFDPADVYVIGDTPRGASLSSYDPAVVAGATYAVTVEPPGGSPTGQPSGAPVFVGKLISVGP